MKYRVVKRAKGWVVQCNISGALMEPYTTLTKNSWADVMCWRFRLLAKLHLLWLRERARK